jgi:hypothetical protein
MCWCRKFPKDWKHFNLQIMLWEIFQKGHVGDDNMKQSKITNMQKKIWIALNGSKWKYYPAPLSNPHEQLPSLIVLTVYEWRLGEKGAVLWFRKLGFLNRGIRSSVYLLQHNCSIYRTTCVFSKSSVIELV